MHSRYKDLDAFKLAAALADGLHGCVRTWPSLDERTLGPQVIRCADSVGANIAEAAGRWSKAERRRFLINARGSLYETEYWIDRAAARGLRLPASVAKLDQIAHALNGLIRRHST
jgi:four helix bundle protein